MLSHRDPSLLSYTSRFGWSSLLLQTSYFTSLEAIIRRFELQPVLILVPPRAGPVRSISPDSVDHPDLRSALARLLALGRLIGCEPIMGAVTYLHPRCERPYTAVTETHA